MARVILSLILIVLISAPPLWLLSEFKGSRRLRIGLGILSMISSIVFAAAWIAMEGLTYSERYGSASGQLIDAIGEALKEGESEKVLESLRQLNEEFRPPYYYDSPPEEYERVVRQAVNRMRVQPATPEISSATPFPPAPLLPDQPSGEGAW